jgi:hypothetical protein
MNPRNGFKKRCGSLARNNQTTNQPRLRTSGLRWATRAVNNHKCFSRLSWWPCPSGALAAAVYSSQKRKAPLGTRGASYMLVPGKGPGNGEFSPRHNIVLIATGASHAQVCSAQVCPAQVWSGVGRQLRSKRGSPKEKAPAWFSRATGASL